MPPTGAANHVPPPIRPSVQGRDHPWRSREAWFRPNVSNVSGSEPLPSQGTALHLIPAEQTVPGVFEAGMHRCWRSAPAMLRPGEGHVALAGVVEVGDAVVRFEGEPPAVGGQFPTHRVRVGIVKIQRPYDHHVPLPALGLVDGRGGERRGGCRRPGVLSNRTEPGSPVCRPVPGRPGSPRPPVPGPSAAITPPGGTRL